MLCLCFLLDRPIGYRILSRWIDNIKMIYEDDQKFIKWHYNIFMSKNNVYQRFYTVIQKIPIGKVATYGQVAEMAGCPGYARQVGYALHATPSSMELPWHRVVNAKGMISIKGESPYDNVQRLLLEAEGIEFDDKGRIPLKKYRWIP